jgi:hypothetical protein
MKPVRAMYCFNLGLLITVFLFSKGTDSNTAKITQLTQSDASHSEINVPRNDPRPECASAATYFFRIECI